MIHISKIKTNNNSIHPIQNQSITNLAEGVKRWGLSIQK